jgi:hypothetical protein
MGGIGPLEVFTGASRIDPGRYRVFTASVGGPVRADTGRLALTADAGWNEAPAPRLLPVPGSPTPPGHPHLVLDADLPM